MQIVLTLILVGTLTAPARADHHAEAATAAMSETAATILQALDLPAQSEAARQQGIAPEQVQQTLTRGKQSGLGADAMAAALAIENQTVQETANKSNFGNFVSQQVDAGLRGKDLATVIHAEKEKRQAAKREQQAIKHQQKDNAKAVDTKPETTDKAHKQKSDGDKGKPETTSKPDSPGKTDAAGKKAKD